MHPISMTGFSDVSFKFKDLNVSIEIKTLNSRYKDFKVKIPYDNGKIEFKIRKLLGNYFNRGRVEFYLNFSTQKSEEEIIPTQLKELALLSGEKDIKLYHHLLYLISENLSSSKQEINFDENFENEIIQQAGLAMEKTRESRINEGKSMTNELRILLKDLLEMCKKTEKIAISYPEKVRQKLTMRIDSFIEREIDKNSLEREIAYLVEKADVNEEIVRLKGHISSFEQLLTRSDPCGRNMEFLCQEMHREINTLGAKSQDFDLSSSGVLMKNQLEKIKEIAANIE